MKVIETERGHQTGHIFATVSQLLEALFTRFTRFQTAKSHAGLEERGQSGSNERGRGDGVVAESVVGARRMGTETADFNEP